MFDPSTFLAPPREALAAFAADVMSSAPHLRGYSDVRWSNRLAPPPRSGARGVKRLGIDYERRVTDVFEALYGRGTFRAQPVIEYRHGRQRHFAIPDGVLRLNGEVIVIEVKLRHTVAVWPQLVERYAPLVRVLEPRSRIRMVEVCRSYDPAVNVPHVVIESLHKPPLGGLCAPLEVLRWKI